jgi:hypothetical protein
VRGARNEGISCAFGVEGLKCVRSRYFVTSDTLSRIHIDFCGLGSLVCLHNISDWMLLTRADSVPANPSSLLSLKCEACCLKP